MMNSLKEFARRQSVRRQMIGKQSTLDLKDRHVGERCFVLGNGPSLAIADLDRLKDEFTFASNKIFLAFGETDWRPNYYMVEDHLVIEQNLNAIRALKGFPKFFPLFASRYFGREEGAIYFNVKHVGHPRDAGTTPDFPGFSHDAAKHINWGSTVVYSQIQLAYFMGFSEIYLLGVDHSYNLPSKKKGNAYISGGEKNHFHASYHLPGQKWHQPQLEILERSYAYAAKTALDLGFVLRNASRKTELETIEKVAFDTLFP